MGGQASTFLIPTASLACSEVLNHVRLTMRYQTHLWACWYCFISSFTLTISHTICRPSLPAPGSPEHVQALVMGAVSFGWKKLRELFYGRANKACNELTKRVPSSQDIWQQQTTKGALKHTNPVADGVPGRSVHQVTKGRLGTASPERSWCQECKTIQQTKKVSV